MSSILTLGLLHSLHMGYPELDKLHPVVEYGNFMYYKNTFDKDSVAFFGRYDNGGFTFRLGFTTGYDYMNEFNGKRYRMPTAIADNFAIFVAPSYNIKVTKDLNVTAVIFGNVLAAGLTIELD